MTVKEFSTLRGISTSAVYKKLKAKELKIKDLLVPGSAELSTDGMEKLKELFPVQQVENKVENSGQVVDGLKTEVENLKKEVENLNNIIIELKGERDFLRDSLERSQQLQALTMARLPQPEKPSLIQRIFGKKGGNNNA